MRKYKIKRICMWCGKFLGDIESDYNGISHGLCEACERKYYPEIWDIRQRKQFDKELTKIKENK